MRRYSYDEAVKSRDIEEVFTDEDEGYGLFIPRRHTTELTEVGEREAQVTYKFSSRIRQNKTSLDGKKYGSDNVTFRALYELLVKKSNKGSYFVDEYFEQIYPSTVKDKVGAIIDTFNQELDTLYKASVERGLTKAGQLNKRYRETKKYFAARAVKDSMLSKQLRDVAEIIKEDLVQSLAIGAIKFKYGSNRPKYSTIERRRYAGIQTKFLFYATGQLINDITIYVRVDA